MRVLYGASACVLLAGLLAVGYPRPSAAIRAPSAHAATAQFTPCACPTGQVCLCTVILLTTPSPTATATAVPTTAAPTATPRPLVWRMLRSQLVRARPDGHSRTGPLVRFGQVVILKGHAVHGWHYIVAGHVRGWVLARNLYRS